MSTRVAMRESARLEGERLRKLQEEQQKKKQDQDENEPKSEEADTEKANKRKKSSTSKRGSKTKKKKKTEVNSDDDDGSSSSPSESSSSSSSSSDDSDAISAAESEDDELEMDIEAMATKQLGYGPDCIIDENDREELESKPMIVREEIIYNRKMNRENLKEKLKLEQTKLRQDRERAKMQKQQEDDSGDKKRKKLVKSGGTRSRKNMSASDKALHDIEKRKNKKKFRKNEAFGSDSDDDSQISDSSASDDEGDDSDFAQRLERAESGGATAKSMKRRGSGPGLVENRNDDIPLDLGDLISMQVTREALLKWFDEPYFDKIEGGFVRLMLPPPREEPNQRTYRVCEIAGSKETSNVYKVEGKRVDKILALRFGKASKEWPIDRISNSPFTESEFEFWKQHMKECKRSIPSKEDAREFREKIYNEITNYTYTEEDILNKIKKNKQRRKTVTNIAMARTEIHRQLSLARMENNAEEIERLQAELKRVEGQLEKLKTNNFNAVATTVSVNERNLETNMKEMEVITKKSGSFLEQNPYARRPTRPTTLWAIRAKDESGQNGNSNKDQGSNSGSKTDEKMANDKQMASASNVVVKPTTLDSQKGPTFETNTTPVKPRKPIQNRLGHINLLEKAMPKFDGDEKIKVASASTRLLGPSKKSTKKKAMSLNEYYKRHEGAGAS